MQQLSQFIKEWRVFILFIILMSVFRSGVADWYTVPTGSMKPTIIEGDRIFVNKMAYGLRVPFTMIPLANWSTPSRGDVVVFQSKNADKRLVKRVVGVAGDVVQIVKNRVSINGQFSHYSVSQIDVNAIEWSGQPAQPSLQSEQFAGHRHDVALSRRDSFFGPVVVPDGHLFVLGDNRDFSADSRYIGFVPEHEILGKANSVIVSLDAEDYYLPRNSRYFKAFDTNQD